VCVRSYVCVWRTAQRRRRGVNDTPLRRRLPTRIRRSYLILTIRGTCTARRCPYIPWCERQSNVLLRDACTPILSHTTNLIQQSTAVHLSARHMSVCVYATHAHPLSHTHYSIYVSFLQRHELRPRRDQHVLIVIFSCFFPTASAAA
jgi:hypothetical protein